MVKIDVENLESNKKEYLNSIKDDVIVMLQDLKLSLSHLSDSALIKECDIVKVKIFTREVVNIVVFPKLDSKDFNKPNYIVTVTNYKKGATRLCTIDFDNLISFIDFLLIDKAKTLDNLLTGNPECILDINNSLISKFKLNETELQVLKLGLSYDSDVGPKIRAFFHSKNFTVFCPYCNLARARHSRNNDTGALVESYQLDHFYSQKDHPLLSLSLFNLVPCDSTCNVTNKGKIRFTQDMHLNPYVAGFKRDFVFVPILDENEGQIIEIELKINVERSSQSWKKLIGDCDKINMTKENGNLNVFQILSKYNCEDVYFQMGQLMKTFHRTAKNCGSIKELLELVENNRNDSFQNVLSWYEESARTAFFSKDFGKFAYSKLYRDLLDYVFQSYTEEPHKKVSEILKSNY